MKIAITGEKGFLGYHLSNYYEKKGHEIIKIGRDFLNNLYLIKDCKILIHAAGVNRATSEQEVYNANVNLANELVKNLKKSDIKINVKFISSIQEGNNTSYGRAKSESREILSGYCNLCGTVFESYKLPNLFGTHGKPNYNSFVNTFAYNIINNLKCVYNDNPVNLCWVYDAIEVIDNLTSTYKLYNTTPSEVYYTLLGINNHTIDPSISCFASKLEEILKYYKL